jgi:predicted phosphodiesterase
MAQSSMWLSAVLVFLTVTIIILFILNFRFLLYPAVPSLNPLAHARQVRLRGNTLFISDLHLKSTEPFKYAKDLRSFIETTQVSNLIVNGDLFYSPKDARRVLGSSPDAASILGKLGLDGLPLNLFWVLGSPAHDPPNPLNDQSDPGTLKVLGKCALIDFGRMQVMAYHGHDLSLKGAFGHAWNRFISKLSLERMWKRVAKVDGSIWALFGHTHLPGVDSRHRVANSGGWQRVPFVNPTKTGLLISDKNTAPELVSIA